jgi:cyclohexanone monooxygenase
LRPGWQAERHLNFNSIVNSHPQSEDLVGDLWTSFFRRLSGSHLVDVPVSSLPDDDRVALAELADMSILKEIHDRIDAIADDPATAAALKPWQGILCKRLCSNDEYLQAFNIKSVTLLSAPAGLDGMNATGIVVDSAQYDVDCVIFATGFETGSASADRYGYDIVGKGGLSLREHFANGAKTLHGFFVGSFPNFVELGLSQNAYLVNFTYMLDRKSRHAARIIAHALANDVRSIEPDPMAQADWVETARQSGKARLSYLARCTPGYYSGQGDLTRGFFNDVYVASEIEFWAMIEEWWKSGDFKGLELAKVHDHEE